MQADPDEIKNLAKSDNPEHQAELKRLRAALETWIRDTKDQGKIPEARAANPGQPKAKKKRAAKRAS